MEVNLNNNKTIFKSSVLKRPVGTQMDSERKLKEINDLRFALDQAAIVAITNARGDITFINEKFCEISQYTEQELLGKNHRIINSGFHPKGFFIDLWKTISSGRVWRGEIKNKAKDGSFYWVFTTIIPLMKMSSSIPYEYVSIRFDITDKKNAENLLENERTRLIHAEKMASLGEMAAGIAHELGNPIAAIQGRIELLEMQFKSGKLDAEKIQKVISAIGELSERMTKIIRGMRALSRDGSADPFYPTNIVRVMSDVLGFSYERFKKNSIIVDFTFSNEDIQVLCKETLISQVFVNLLNNARDAIESFEEKWIKVHIQNLPHEWIEISVTDCGNGIKKGVYEKMFDPFFTTKDVGKGSGLGLSISKSIIEDHKGEFFLDLSSKNTKFVIRLPQK